MTLRSRSLPVSGHVSASAYRDTKATSLLVGQDLVKLSTRLRATVTEIMRHIASNVALRVVLAKGSKPPDCWKSRVRGGATVWQTSRAAMLSVTRYLKHS
jgi:hypothetical protein